MTTRSKFIIFFTLFVIWLSTSIYIVVNQFERLSSKAAQKINYRALNIQQQVNIAVILAEQLRKQVEHNISLTTAYKLRKDIAYIKDYPELNRYGSGFLDGDNQQNLVNPNFSLSGLGLLSEINDDTRNEVNAILLLALSTKMLSNINPDFEWVYYVSKNEFLAITPLTFENEFQFDTDLFTKEFWTESAPESNPERKTLITSLYDDFWGKGHIFTLTSPVYIDDEFKGVAAVDLKTSELEEHLELSEFPGALTLVDEKGYIVAAKYDFNIGEKLQNFSLSNENSNKFILNDDFSSSYITPVIKNELYLVHKVTLKQKFSQLISANTLVSLFIVSSLMLTISLLFVLRKTLLKNIKLANYDNLTQLYNRRTIKVKTEDLFQTSSTEELYVLMLDIDKFKSINDTYGHSMGDKVISQVAHILRENCRVGSDYISRLGGEEFLIITSNVNATTVQQIAERIRKSIESCEITHPHNENISTKVTISIGIVKRRNEETYDNALNRADVNLYKAKSGGRNRIEMTI